MIERLLLGLIADGNLLVEGLPGLAKTRAIKTLARHLDAKLSRIQFTPDLLPSDVTGSEVYQSAEGKGTFVFQEGPIFANLVLADEVNRAPAKVQAVPWFNVAAKRNEQAIAPGITVDVTAAPASNRATHLPPLNPL